MLWYWENLEKEDLAVAKAENKAYEPDLPGGEGRREDERERREYYPTVTPSRIAASRPAAATAGMGSHESKAAGPVRAADECTRCIPAIVEALDCLATWSSGSNQVRIISGYILFFSHVDSGGSIYGDRQFFFSLPAYFASQEISMLVPRAASRIRRLSGLGWAGDTLIVTSMF